MLCIRQLALEGNMSLPGLGIENDLGDSRIGVSTISRVFRSVTVGTIGAVDDVSSLIFSFQLGFSQLSPE